jgi:hypothetical protein
MATVMDAVRDLIESRLVEIDAEARPLERVSESLGSESSRGRRKNAVAAPTPTKPRPSRKRKSTKRAPRGERRDQLFTALKAAPGARPTELAKAIGIRPAQVHALISKARAEKLIVKRGKGYALKS